MKNSGFVLLISGPSGAGKSTLLKLLLEEFKEELYFSVSSTTRKPREGEIDGVHYHFHALIANTGNIQFIDSGIKHNDNIIYNIGNWKFGFTTASKVIDSARASSYITKYITKDLCSVTKYKKRYWSSRNCDRPKVRTYCLPYEEIGKFLDDNIHLLQYTKEVVIDSCGLAVTYIEMKKE